MEKPKTTNSNVGDQLSLFDQKCLVESHESASEKKNQVQLENQAKVINLRNHQEDRIIQYILSNTKSF